MPRHTHLPLWLDADTDEKLEKLRTLVEDLYRHAHGPALARISATLAAHPCADDGETRDVAFIRDFCTRQPFALNKGCEEGHITGSALVLHPPSRRVLLTHHRKLHIWLQFGGHGEGETDPAEIALREAIEESGLPDLALVSQTPLDVNVHTYPTRGDIPEHLHLDLRYLAITNLPDLALTSEESHDIRWFTFDELATMPLNSEMQRLLAKAAAWLELK
ncbi:MAG: NUDIX hydrolase [Chloroflexi bacterium]|nr:NUDIX hydrolase [Chloroflexota bacterium]